MISKDDLAAMLRDLSASDASVRRTAAEALAGSDERGIYPLIRSLRDENAGVQDAAMRSLIAVGGEVTAYMALPLLREGPYLRNTARIILKQIGHPSVPLLRPLLADKDDDIRTFAVDLIADIGSCGYPADVCRLLETDPNQNVRASAARALGVLGYGDGVPALLAALRDGEWVCFSALESLAALRDESSVGPILALLRSPLETLRYAAIEALGRIGSPRSSEALIALLPKAGAIEKNAIVRSLVQIGMTPAMEDVADLLIEMYRDGDWDERLIALTGLADLKSERALPVILDVAGSLDRSDPENDERLQAVRHALMKFDCLSALARLLADPSVRFRGKVIAVEVIGELQCREAVPALTGLLDTDLREVRRAAVLALAGIKGDDALSVLRRCIDDRDGHVRSAAISELGRMGDRDSFDHLLRHLDTENYRDVLEDNVRALVQIDPERFVSRLDTLPVPVRELLARCTGNTDILVRLSREAEAGVRLAALSNLGRITNACAHDRLCEALDDADPEARKTAVIALGCQNAGIDDIKKALSDADLWVRIHAVNALGESRNPDAARLIIPLLYAVEVPIVLSAIDALVKLGNIEAVVLGALQNHPDEQVRERVKQVAEQVC